MSIQIRFLVESGTDFAPILGAKTASVARVVDPSFGAGALGTSKNDVKTPHPIVNPLRHRFRCDFLSILKEIFLKPCVYKPCSVVLSDQLRSSCNKQQTHVHLTT